MEITVSFKLTIGDARLGEMRERFGNERIVRDIVKTAVVSNVVNHIAMPGDAITIESCRIEEQLPPNVVPFPMHRVKAQRALEPSRS